MIRRAISALILLILSIYPSLLVTNLNSVSAQSDLAESLNSIFGNNQTNNTVTNLTKSLQPAGQSTENNKTCNVPVERPAVNATTTGLVATKSIEPHEILAYGLNSQNSTLPQNATVTISIKGFGGISEKISAVDVVFSIDGSGSMEQNDPDNLRIAAAKSFIDSLNPQQDAAGIISWSSKLDLQDGLSSDFSSLKSKLDAVERKAGTNLNIGITGAIEMLDKSSTNTQLNPTKSIVLLTDGKGEYTKSGMAGSPADEARTKGYKIFPIGLNVVGTDAEIDLKDIANTTGGQYFSAPTAENLDLVFNQIFQKVTSVTAPSNVRITEVSPSYMVVHENSVSIPLSDITQDEEKTVLVWDNISQSVGNMDNNLDQNETFSVQFTVSSSRQGKNIATELDSAAVSFLDSSGQQRSVPIPVAYLDVQPFEVAGSSQGASPSEPMSSTAPAAEMWVRTDKAQYGYGETINFYGNVGKSHSTIEEVNVMLCDKDGNLLKVFEPLLVNFDGSFSGSTDNFLDVFSRNVGDIYLYAKYGDNATFTDAYDKYQQTDKHVRIGPNPESGITISLDKQVYRNGETVNLKGSVGKPINITDPSVKDEVRMDTYGKTLQTPYTEYLPLNENGTFSTSFTTTDVGLHIILITYDKKSAETGYQTR